MITNGLAVSVRVPPQTIEVGKDASLVIDGAAAMDRGRVSVAVRMHRELGSDGWTPWELRPQPGGGTG
jgi:hypothetical protein